MPVEFDPPIIGTFQTREGDVRLTISAAEDVLPDLLSELRGCAAVADSMDEFLTMALRVTRRSDAIIGDVFRQPYSVRVPLRDALRSAAIQQDPRRAARAVVTAPLRCGPDERSAFLGDPDWSNERSYVSDLLVGLDEMSVQVALEMSQALGVSVEDLERSLAAGN